MSKSSVISINGHEIHDPRNPDRSVIQVVRDLLERAEAGELIGLCYGVQYHDKTGTHHFVGTGTSALVGNTFSAAARLARLIDDAP